MRIADMEAHHDAMMDLENTINVKVYDRDFSTVFDVCEETFPHIVPSIQFRKKRDIKPETPELVSFLIIYRYAPSLFEHRIIESLLEFIQGTRLLAKHEAGYLELAQTALLTEEAAKTLWGTIERHPGILKQDIQHEFRIKQDLSDHILAMWEELGVIAYQETDGGQAIYLPSCANVQAEGICHSCGMRGKGRKELFYKPVPCTKCGTTDYFCITNTIHK